MSTTINQTEELEKATKEFADMRAETLARAKAQEISSGPSDFLADVRALEAKHGREIAQDAVRTFAEAERQRLDTAATAEAMVGAA